MMLEKKNTSRFWLISCVALWGSLCTVYFVYLTHLLIGNHDFRFLRFGTKFSSGFWEGRFTQFLFPYIALENQILPVFVPVLGFLFLALTAVISAQIFRVSRRFMVVLPFGLLIVLHPILLSQLYYLHQFVSITLWFLLCSLGVFLANRSGWYFPVISVLCYAFSFSGYIGSLELVLTLILGQFLSDVLAGDKSEALFRRYARHIVVLLAGFIVFYSLFYIMNAKGVVEMQMYNVNHASVPDILANLWNKAFFSWADFFDTFPYVSHLLMFFPLVLAGAVLVIAYHRRRFLAVLFILFLFGYAMYALAYLSSKNIFYMYRVQCYSIPFFTPVLFAVIRRFGKTGLCNLSLGCALILIVFYMRADFMVQKVWLLGNMTDEKTIDRVRADIMPKLEANKTYRLTLLGGLHGRMKFLGFSAPAISLNDRYREIYGYSYILPVFADSTLFLYEAFNPIIGSGFAIGRFMQYGVNNEFIIHRETAKRFAQSVFPDADILADRLLFVHPYPAEAYFIKGEKDLFVSLSKDSDNVYRSIVTLNKSKEITRPVF